MDNENQTMSLFPEGMVICLNGFDYCLSSKPIVEGDLMVYKDYPLDPFMPETEENQGMIVVAICRAVLGDTLEIQSSEMFIAVPKDRCKRLTFTIPVNKDHIINN